MLEIRLAYACRNVDRYTLIDICFYEVSFMKAAVDRIVRFVKKRKRKPSRYTYNTKRSGLLRKCMSQRLAVMLTKLTTAEVSYIHTHIYINKNMRQ